MEKVLGKFFDFFLERSFSLKFPSDSCSVLLVKHGVNNLGVVKVRANVSLEELKNKIKAMAVLRSRLLDIEQQKADAERGGLRRSQLGSGDRSEKIRTYNFPQDRVTDHRLKTSLSNLPGVLDGDIDGFIRELQSVEQAERLQLAGIA